MQIKYVFMIFVLLAFSGSATKAADSLLLKSQNIPKLNNQVKMSKEEFDAKTTLIQETPLDNKFLAYRIRLPKDWTKLNIAGDETQNGLSKQLLGEIARYLGPPTLDLRSLFRVRANDLSYDITARDWFLGYVFGNNFTLQGLHVSSDKQVEAQYIMVDNGVQKVARAIAVISGPRIVLAEYIVPVDFWETEADTARTAISTFVLTNPDPSPIEKIETYPFVDIAKFSYPASWVLISPPITSIERMSASVTNLRGKIPDKTLVNNANTDALLVDGRIDVSVVTKGPDTNLPKELEAVKKEMLEKGLVLGQLIEPIEGWPHNEAIIFGRIDAYEVNDVKNKLSDYEQWVGVFETPGRYYFLRLLTISRKSDFLTWARNVLAYKKVVASLSPVVAN